MDRRTFLRRVVCGAALVASGPSRASLKAITVPVRPVLTYADIKRSTFAWWRSQGLQSVQAAMAHDDAFYRAFRKIHERLDEKARG